MTQIVKSWIRRPNAYLFLGWIVFYCFIGIAFKKNWHSLTHNFARVYEQMFLCGNYDYFPLYEKDYLCKGSRSHKIFCKKEFATPEMFDILEHYEDIYLHVLQCHRGITTRDFTINGQKFVIKSAHQRGFLKHLLFMSRAVNICNNGIWANNEGIKTLKPVALIENRGWLNSGSAVVYLFEGIPLGELLVQRPELFPKVDRLIQDLIDKSIIHHDFHIYNFVVLEDNSVQLIDIDKLHQYPFSSYIFHKRLSREIRKFNKRVVQDTVAPQRLKQV